LWDISATLNAGAQTGNAIPLAGPIDASDGLMFSPDGTRLVTVTPVNLPRIWDLRTANELVSFPGHTDYTSFAFLSADGKRLISTSDDGTARIWNAFTGEELLKLEHASWVWTAAFSPDGTRAATVSGSDAFVWDAATGEKLFTLRGHANDLFAVAFSPDGTRLVTGGEDRKVKVWDASSGRELFALPGHAGAIYSLAFTPDGTRLASGSDDGMIHIWDMTSGGEALALSASSMSSISLTSDGTRLAAIVDGAALIWDAADGKQLQRFASPDKMNAARLRPDGKILATADAASNVTLWDAASGAPLFIWPAHSARINALAFSPDGVRLVTASADFKARVWDVSDAQNPQLLTTLELSADVNAVAFNADGSLLLVGLNNGIARLRDFSSNTDLVILRGHADSISAVAFSLDGSMLATASLDGTAKIWDAKTGEELFTLAGHTDAATGVAFSPDAKRVATVGRDGGAKLWDASTGQEALALPGDNAALTGVAFSPDGKRLVVSGEGGARGYLLHVDDLAALARTRVTRPLSVEECQEYLHGVSSACAQPFAAPTLTPLPPTANGRICQVTNMGGLYDNYFNSMIFKGLQDSSALYGWDATALQSASAADFEKNLQALVDADCKLIVSPLALFEQTQGVAQDHPDEKFMMMDFVYDAPVDNIWNQVYAADQAAFLAGYVAASVTKTGKVGVFGGVDIPQVTGFMDGFALGVDYYNQKNGTIVEVLGWDARKHEGLFVGGFCCTTEGRRLARQLLDAGADVILPVAGHSVGWGAGAEVYEYGNAWLIGVDNDWVVPFPEFESIIITSIEKRFDVSIVLASNAIAEGKFTGGIHVGTLETEEVRLAPFHQLESLISEQVKADLEQIMSGIITGKIQTRP
jgi:WD40 repeat protein/basic membrane lipoprotein Med (substrate-binding protein (PBP1-ABC) superfamily)